MDAKEVVQRMKDFGLKGVRDGSVHLFISPDLLAEFMQSEIIAEREECAKVCEAHANGWEKNPGNNPMAGFIATSNCAFDIRGRSNPYEAAV